MVDSDKSDNGESLTTGKRSREDHSGDEKSEHPSKRPRSKSPEPQETIDNKKDVIVQVTNGSTLSSEEKTDTVNLEDEHKNGEAVSTDDDTEIINKGDDSAEVEMEVEPVEKSKEDGNKKEDEGVEVSKDTKKAESDAPLQDKSIDSEVVDGLELSVECASDKEASSSESDTEKDSKPRPKTIIVKAKPNDSELEVGSSEAEKSDIDEKIVDEDSTNKKRIGKRKSLVEASSSRSEEESLESNSDDDDYSPRTKKKLKKTVTPKKATPQKTKAKKERESKKKSVTDSEDNKSESEDEEMNLAERAKKIFVKSTTNKIPQKDNSDSESVDEADSANDSEDKNKKNGKRKRGNTDPKDDKTIKMLRKYITTAGIRVKFDDVWSGCKTNTQRANRLKKLLEENGIVGRPTLEKCKKLKIKNATKKEVAELDTGNIISEGRVTRARRIEANKAGLGTPIKHREARTLFKRIQPVCDSDTE